MRQSTIWGYDDTRYAGVNEIRDFINTLPPNYHKLKTCSAILLGNNKDKIVQITGTVFLKNTTRSYEFSETFVLKKWGQYYYIDSGIATVIV